MAWRVNTLSGQAPRAANPGRRQLSGLLASSPKQVAATPTTRAGGHDEAIKKGWAKHLRPHALHEEEMTNMNSHGDSDHQCLDDEPS